MASIDILDDYVRIGPFADALGKHPRTILRWISMPCGLPVARLGKTALIHLPTARQWLLDRIQRPNLPQPTSRSPRTTTTTVTMPPAQDMVSDCPQRVSQ